MSRFRCTWVIALAALFAGPAVGMDELAPERPAAVPSDMLDASQGQYAVIAPIFTGADGNVSFIRLLNNANEHTGTSFTSTTYTVSMVGSPSGLVYGTATIVVPGFASPQYAVSEILTLARVTALQSSSDTAYSLYITNPDEGAGYVHAIYSGSSGFFENASICQAYIPPGTDSQYLFNVHTSRLPGYPSQVYMHNLAPTAVTTKVTVRDGRTGTVIGSTDLQIGANATTTMPFSAFEQRLGWTPTVDQQHANMTFQAAASGGSAPLLVSTFVTNQALSSSVNMSVMCSVNSGDSEDNGGGSSTYLLTLTRSGLGFGPDSNGGSGGLITSSPAGINCGTVANGGPASPICEYAFPANTAVSLILGAGNGVAFSGWSGACSGTGACTVTTTSTHTLTATFGTASTPRTITVAKATNGNVTSSPAGINCGAVGNDCTATFAADSTVTLTALASSGATFSGWSSNCTVVAASNPSTCNVAAGSNQSVIATFATAATRSISVTKATAGNVTSSPAGINCGALGNDCTATFQADTTVTLSALASSGFSFDVWSSNCIVITPSNPSTCNVAAGASQNLTATFKTGSPGTGPRIISVTKPTSGNVTSSPAGINCGAIGNDCTATFAANTIVTLTALASNGSTFSSWSSNCAVVIAANPNVCNVGDGTSLNVVASFGGSGSNTSGPVTLNFDSITGAGCVDATSYLAGYGVTISQASAGTLLSAGPANGCFHSDVVVPSSPNALYIPSNAPISFTMNFDRALSSVRFTRAQMNAGVSGVNTVGWTATAYNAVNGGGTQVGQTGEDAKFGFGSPITAASFTVAGTGIRSVVFVRTNPAGQNTNFGVSFAVFDDLILTP